MAHKEGVFEKKLGLQVMPMMGLQSLNPNYRADLLLMKDTTAPFCYLHLL